MTRSRAFLLAAALLFLLLRVVDLGAWALFIDEAQHLHWARRLWSWPPFLRPLTDGKALQVVLAGLVVPWVEDPVRAGRLLSVAAGALALAATVRTADLLGGTRAALAAAFLYAAVPFAVIHERLALADPWLAAGGAAVLLQTVRLVLGLSSSGVLLGLALGAAVLAKVPWLVLFAIPAAAAIAARNARRPLLVGLVIGALIAAVPAGYFFTSTAQLDEKLEGPDDAIGVHGLLIENAGYALAWFWRYLTPLLSALAAAGLVHAAWKGPLSRRLVVLASLLPVLAFVGSYYWFPRYVLPSVAPLVVLAALLVAEMPLAAGVGIVAAAVAWGVAFDVRAVREPARVLPDVDRFQYVDGWPAGGAADAAWRKIAQEAGGAPALVVVDNTGHSTVHYVLRTRFMNDDRVEVLVSALDDAQRSGLLERERHTRRVFVVVTTRRRGKPRPFPPEGLPATLLQDLVRADGTLAGRLYELGR